MSAKTDFIKACKLETWRPGREIQSEVHKEWCRVLVKTELEEWEAEREKELLKRYNKE